MIGVVTTGPRPWSTTPAALSVTSATWARRATVCSTKMSRGRHSRPAARARATTCIDKMLSPPSSKNESSTPTRSNPRHLGVNPGQNLLDRTGRGAVAISVGVLRCRQRTLVQLAVSGQRQRLEHHHRRRHHIARQPLTQRARIPAGSAVRLPDSVTYPTSRLSPGRSSRAITTACPTPSQRHNAARTSPSSMRYPRILTCSSARPT